MLICTDCRYSQIGGYTGCVLCEHPRLGTEMDTGKQKWRYASNMRDDVTQCGPEGTWFAPSDTMQQYASGWRLVLGIAVLVGLIALGFFLTRGM